MRVLLITTFLQGGAGRVIFDLAVGLNQAGHFAAVVTTEKGEDDYGNYEEYLVGLRKHGIALYLVDSTFKRDVYRNVAAAALVRRLITEEQIDLLHTHAAVPSLVGIIARSGLGRRVPIVQTVHDGLGWGLRKTPAQRGMDTVIINGVEQVVTVSDGAREFFVGQGIEASKIKVVYNGIGPPPADVGPSDPDWRILCQLRQQGERIIGCVGTVCERKNQALLIEALALLSARYTQLHAVFIGEGEIIPTLKKRADELGLERRVHFLGYKRQAARYMRLFDCLVLPSRSEALPLAPLEAFRERVPVVASDIPGVNEVVTDGHTGTLFASEDAEGLALAVDRVLSLTPEAREALVQRGYAEYRKRFTTSTMLENYLRIYAELLQGSAVQNGNR